MNTFQKFLLFVLILIVIIGVAIGNGWLTQINPAAGQALGLFGIAIALVLLTRLVRERTGIRRRRFDSDPVSGLRTLGQLMLLVLIVSLVTDAITIAMGYAREVVLVNVILLLAFPAVALLYLLFLAVTTWARRRATDRVVIGQLAMVVRQNLPLATGVMLAAQSERGGARRILTRLAKLLAQGIALGEAVERGFPDCPSIPRTLIRAGERSGQLRLALDQAEIHLVQRAREREGLDMSFVPFALTLLIFASLLVAGIMVAIVPKFKEIFRDFGTQLPPITLALIGVCDFVVESGLLAILTLVVIVAVPLGVYLRLRPRRTPTLAWTSRWADWVRWHLPGWRRIEFSRGLSTVLRTMQMGTRAGLGLDKAAQLAQFVDVNHCLRPQVDRFALLVSAGTNVRAAAEEAGLSSVVAVALESGQRCSNLDAGIRYAAEYHETMAQRFWITLRALAWPVGTIILGAIVGFIALALFVPLPALINSVAG